MRPVLSETVYEDLDRRLASVDAALGTQAPGGEAADGEAPGSGRGAAAAARRPVHMVCVPADRVHARLVPDWSALAVEALRRHPPAPFPDALAGRVLAKLRHEPIEHLCVDFEDGYGMRDDEEEDAAARAAAAAVRTAPHPGPPFLSIRCKSLEAATRRRAVRTLDVFLGALGPPPEGFTVLLPKAGAAEQVTAMAVLCAELEKAHGLPPGRLRFDVQVETPAAVLGADGTATVARMVRAGEGRLTALHYGTYDYSAACGIAAACQSLEHPVADHAKAVMQVAAAGTGVRVVDGSTNVLPVGGTAEVQAAWHLHARLVRRSLERGFYQGWDLHPAQLPTRYAATYAFYRDGLAAASRRLTAYLDRHGGGTVLDEPATARALAGFLLRGLSCGAFDEDEAGFDAAALGAL